LNWRYGRGRRGLRYFLSLSGVGHDFEERNDANARLALLITVGFLDEHLKGRSAK
jgi:hypothetical protein